MYKNKPHSMTSIDVSKNIDQHNVRYKSDVSLQTELWTNTSELLVPKENNSNCKVFFYNFF